MYAPQHTQDLSSLQTRTTQLNRCSEHRVHNNFIQVLAVLTRGNTLVCIGTTVHSLALSA